MRFERPTELADHLVFLSTIDANHSDEHGGTSASAFADALRTLAHFIELAPSDEGKERLRQCERNLHLAFQYLETGDDVRSGDLVMETAEMFSRCRKYIALSDE